MEASEKSTRSKVHLSQFPHVKLQCEKSQSVKRESITTTPSK
ncbi:hypothetical protein HMPREF0293_2679 [Corynebacterium glucuronolyticum ATCC 51866]|uniref:Uncharacterized protein n=1 Tax=Corynebacterium glucuronolyticum ATCC 51866 TaxID=548478 RepID=A0ABM9XL06_9CORY|nr:hypothetical protein HMPREF0293_2679 [Corynebacterium glucuronolyticum ATCC 51866]